MKGAEKIEEEEEQAQEEEEEDEPEQEEEEKEGRGWRERETHRTSKRRIAIKNKSFVQLNPNSKFF